MADVLPGQITMTEFRNRHRGTNYANIADVIWKGTELVRDAIWVEGNGLNTHMHTRLTEYPDASVGVWNRGTLASSAKTKQLEEPIVTLETLSFIDNKVMKRATNPTKLRSDEDLAHTRALSLKINNQFLGLDADVGSLKGMFQRYPKGADQVKDIGGASSVMSIVLVHWDKEEGLSFVYPAGNPNMGIDFDNRGLGQITDPNDAKRILYGWSSYFSIDMGFQIKDDYAVGRVINIPTDGTKVTETVDAVIEIMNRMPNRGANCVVYGGYEFLDMIDKAAKDKVNVHLQMGEFAGRIMTTIRQQPVRLLNQLVVGAAE